MANTPLELMTDINSNTTDAILRHVDNHVDATHDAAIAATTDGPPAPGTPQFCAIYTAARPVLVFVKGMLFFRPKWQAIVTALLGGLDTICPQ
jgi:hypothetical protein